MTLAEWNAARKWLKRMEHIGYITHRLNHLRVLADHLDLFPLQNRVVCFALTNDLRAYRRIHRFYEPIPLPPAQVQACEDALADAWIYPFTPIPRERWVHATQVD